MRLACIPLICSHAPFDLPVREIIDHVTGSLQLGKSQRAYATEFWTSLAGLSRGKLTRLEMEIAIPLRWASGKAKVKKGRIARIKECKKCTMSDGFGRLKRERNEDAGPWGHGGVGRVRCFYI